MTTLGIDMGFGDYTVVISEAALKAAQPKLERERFSGGVNLSAQDRNRRRLEDLSTRMARKTHEAIQRRVDEIARAQIQGALRASGEVK